MRELGKTHDVMRFAFFDHFPYTKHVECGALLVARPRKAASADQPDMAAHEKPDAKPAKEATPAKSRKVPARSSVATGTLTVRPEAMPGPAQTSGTTRPALCRVAVVA